MPTAHTPELIHYAGLAFNALYREGYLYKKAGVLAAGIVPDTEIQQDLFDTRDRDRQRRVMDAVDRINRAFGRETVRSAAQGFDRAWRLRQEKLSPAYTTRWSDLLVAKV